MREFRLFWLGAATRVLVQRPHWTRCSVVPKGLLIPYEQLAHFDLDAAVKRLRKRLERSQLHGRIVLGAIDVSLNLENNVIQGWQWHLYLLIEGQNDAELQQAVKDAFPAEPTALAPYDFREVVDHLKVLTYAYKSLFKRRSGYLTPQGDHRTKDQPLKGADLRELLPFLVNHKTGARLILSGLRRSGERLVFTRRKPHSP
jgi:hypothetical protein